MLRVEKQLAVIVESYDINKAKTVVELLDLVQCEDGKAQSLVNNLLNLLEKRKIPLKKYFHYGYHLKLQ
jgi:hypothetical protein